MARRKFKLDIDTNTYDNNFNIRFDISTLNNIIGFVFKLQSPLVTRKALMRINELFNFINLDIYKDSVANYERIIFIKDALEAILTHKYENIDMILSFCRTDVENDYKEEIISNLDIYTNLNSSELRSVIKTVEDRLKFIYVLSYRDMVESIMNTLDKNEYRSYKEINDMFLDMCTSYINKSRKVSTYDNEQAISLSDEDFDDKITNIVNDSKDPARYIKTGIKTLNDMLGVGYANKRLYMYMGLPAGFKSGILLKSAIDAKLYNPNIKGRTLTKIPTVVLVTMENFLEETIERLFNMVGPEADIRNFTPKQVINILRETGKLKITEENRIDIMIKYIPHRTISTADLYSMIEDLNDDNREVIMLVLDYIKRIRSAERADTEKEELKNISNELKSLAIDKKISVITAHQLNREGARSVDAAMQASKTDLARFVGRANVGSAWEIMENSDCCIIINRERRASDKKFFLTFKKVKQRYKTDIDMDYFNHPFAQDNGMKLVDDIYLEEPISEISLSSDFYDASDDDNVVDDKRNNAVAREDISSKKGKITQDDIKQLNASFK